MLALFSMSVYPRKGGSAVVTEELARCFGPGEMIVVGGRKLLEPALPRDASEVRFLSLGSELNIKGRGDRFFEAFRWFLLPFLLWRATAFCRRHHCTRVIATFPDELFLLLGLLVANRLRVPFYAYFHNTLVENRSGWRAAVARYVQRRVFAAADNILVISEGLERFYREKYPGVRFTTVPHVFAGRACEPAAKQEARRAVRTVALCGNFNQSNLDATRRVIEALYGSGEYRIVLYTPVPPLLLRMRGIDVDKVDRIDYVSDNDFMARLAEADLLVLTHGLVGGLSEVEYRTIFPTRTVPLLLAGRPLLVHAPRASFLSEFIREHQCGLVVDEADEQAIRKAARDLTTDTELAQTLVCRAREASAMFHGNAVRARFLSGVGLGVAPVDVVIEGSRK